MYTVYILLCNDNTLYTGITNDLEKRFILHQQGKASRYTRSRGVVKIVYAELVKTKSKALQREAAIKKLSRVQKQLLVKNNRSITKKYD